MKTSIEKRNRAFAATCRQIKETFARLGYPRTIERVIEAALDSRAPAYFVDAAYASRLMHHYDRTGTLPAEALAQGDKWVDFAHDYDDLCQRYPNRRRGYLVNLLCSGAAGRPRYYLSPRQALEAYYC